MLHKLDTRIIGLFDRATTWIQRRGILPLNTLIMGVDCLFWSTCAMRNSGWYAYLFAAVAGIMLLVAFCKWRDAIGYWENYRKTLALNAQVLLIRETMMPLRLGFLCFAPIVEIIIWQAVSCISSISLICALYLKCCRYLGPGDFAKEKRESLAGSLETNLRGGSSHEHAR